MYQWGKRKIDLDQFKIIFFTVAAILTLLVASPALQHFLVYPQTEFFTELWLLGPNQRAENYPYNITQHIDNQVYLGLSNHLGYCGYYLVEVKARNQTKPGPDTFAGTASNLPTLYILNVFVADQQTVQVPVDFSFDYSNNGDRINFQSITLNGEQILLNGYSTAWNSTNNDYYFKLVFELYLYNSTLGNFQYNQRFVDLRLNMTV
jgi:uncharacterized membrane protein